MKCPEESVEVWIEALQSGDENAVAGLWDRFFEKLVRVAEAKLGAQHQRHFDGEDVALSVFDTVCRGAARGQYSDLVTENDLWRLMKKITNSKLIDRHRKQNAIKRGGGDVRGESVFGQGCGDEIRYGIGDVAGEGVPPEILASLEEEHHRLMELLADDSLRRVASLRIQGYSVLEIATEIGQSDRNVKRKLERVRRTWQLAADSGGVPE